MFARQTVVSQVAQELQSRVHTRSLLLTYQVSFTYIPGLFYRQTVVSQVAQELQSRVKGTHALKINQVSFTSIPGLSFNYIPGLFYLLQSRVNGNARAQNQPGRDSRKSCPSLFLYTGWAKPLTFRISVSQLV
jgi:hypothetical protein